MSAVFSDMCYIYKLNPLPKGFENHFCFCSEIYLSTLGNLVSLEKTEKDTYVSMGVSKLCHFKGEPSLMDYVYYEWINI